MKFHASLVVGALLFAPALPFAHAADSPTGSALYSPPAKAGPGASPAKGAVKAVVPGGSADAATPASSGAVKTSGSSGGKSTTASAKSKGNRKGKPKVADAVALNGRWQDSRCIPLAAAAQSTARLYLLRRYEFSDARKTWTLSADVFDSERCTVDSKLLTYSGRGSFAVTGQSAVGRNVYDATFKPVQWEATPFSRDGTLTLFNARCGRGDFAEGRTIDLSRSGCPMLGIASTDRPEGQSELVRVADGMFYLGAKSFVPGFADERPTQLSSYGLTRL